MDKGKLCFLSVYNPTTDMVWIGAMMPASWTCNNHNSSQGSDVNPQGSEELPKFLLYLIHRKYRNLLISYF